LKNIVFPALALVLAVTAGLILLRDNLTANVNAKPALAETAETDADAPVISAHQIRTASLRKEGDGHYWATAYVNGTPVKFLVDTGASLVALTLQDARKAGIDTDKLQKNAEVRTAGGKVQAATAFIEKIEIDGVKIENVQAVIIDKGLEHSLLGMSFLNRLDRWDVTANAIVIKQ